MKALKDKLIINTRPAHQAAALTALLRLQGAEVIEIPLLQISPPQSWAPVETVLNGIGERDWFVFTSANAPLQLSRFIKENLGTSFDIETVPVAAISEETARVAAECGFNLSFVGKAGFGSGFAEEFAQFLRNPRILAKGVGKLFHMRGSSASLEFEEQLKATEFLVCGLTVYESVPVPLRPAALAGLIERLGEVALIVLTSPLSAKALNAELSQSRERLRTIPVAVIGPKTAAEAKELGLRLEVISVEPSVESLVSGIVQYFGPGNEPHSLQTEQIL